MKHGGGSECDWDFNEKNRQEFDSVYNLSCVLNFWFILAFSIF